MMRTNVICAIILVATVAQPATYYVRADGGSASRCTGLADAADPGSGTAQACSWNLSGYMSSTSAAGDTIQWRCGDAFRGLWTTRGAGTEASPVLHTRYGSGCTSSFASNPAIKGSIIPSSWTDAGSNRWTATVSEATPGKVHFNGVAGTKKTSQAAVTAARDWYYSNTTLTVYSTSNPSSAYTSPGVEVSVYSTPLMDAKHAHNHIYYLDCLQSNYTGVVLEKVGCRYKYARTGQHVRHGFNNVLDGSDATVAYVEAFECGVDQYGNGIYLSGYDCTTCGTVTAEFLNVHDIAGSGISFHGTNGGTVRYADVRNAKWGLNCGDANNGKTMTFDTVLSHNNYTSDFYSVMGTELGAGSTTCDVRNSLFYGTDIGVTVAGTGAAGGSGYVLKIRNTAMFGHTTLAAYFDAAADLASYQGDFNLWKNASSGYIIQGAGTIYTQDQKAAWSTASGDDANSIVGDPQVFDAANGKFQPITGSPLIRMGTDLGTGYGFHPRQFPLPGTWPDWSLIGRDASGWNIGPAANSKKVVQ